MQSIESVYNLLSNAEAYQEHLKTLKDEEANIQTKRQALWEEEQKVQSLRRDASNQYTEAQRLMSVSEALRIENSKWKNDLNEKLQELIKREEELIDRLNDVEQREAAIQLEVERSEKQSAEAQSIHKAALLVKEEYENLTSKIKSLLK